MRINLISTRFWKILAIALGLFGGVSCVSNEDIDNILAAWNGATKEELVKVYDEPFRVENGNDGNEAYIYRLRKIQNPNVSRDATTGVIVQRKVTGSRINKASAYGATMLECNVKFIFDKDKKVKESNTFESDLKSCDLLLKRRIQVADL